MLKIDQAQALPIAPVKVKDLPAFLKAVEPVARALMEGDLLAALATHAEEVIAATAIGAGVERAELEESEADVLVLLATRVMEANADFFVRRVMPALTQAAERIAAISTQSSTTGSSGSAAQVSAMTR